jgi:basic membrane lipoprotein Med (substrate-binding protein (PBP1-ABC) superfamily)
MALRILALLLLLLLLLLPALPLVSAAAIGDLTPDLLPANIGRPVPIRVSVLPSSTTSLPLTLLPPDNSGSPLGTPISNVAAASAGVAGQLLAELPDTPLPGAGILHAGSVASGSPLRYYAVPQWSAVAAPAFTTAGLSTLALTRLQAGPALPSTDVRVLVACSTVATGPAAPASFVSAVAAAGGQVAIADPGTGARSFVYTAFGTVDAAGNTVSIKTMGTPTSGCAYADLYVSVNGGWHWHYTGQTLSLTPFSKINLVSLYPFKVGLSPWVVAHNTARIAVSTSFASAVNAEHYFEESWRVPALPTGRLVDTSFFQTAISDLNSTFIICAGTQFNATALSVAASNPGVKILILSTLRQVLPPRPNLAFASGKMYEALYLAGFIAASASQSGRLGFIASLLHPGSFAFINSFLLGARAAHRGGFTSLPPSAPPNVTAWVIGAFSDDWAEQNAARDLLARGVDVLMPVTDNTSPQLACHAAGCLSIGFNDNERLLLGDRVLVSAVFNLAPIYVEFARRIVVGDPFGPDSYMGGLGAGVDLTAMSPLVPIAAQREVDRLAALSRASSLEEIFCGDILDAGTSSTPPAVRLNGTTGQTRAGMAAHVVGEGGRLCLADADINSMLWVVQGVDYRGRYVPPPKAVGPTPVAWLLPQSLAAGIAILPAFVFLLAAVSAVGVWLHRRMDVVRYSSPPFLFIINIGAALFGAVLLKDALVDPVTTDSCVASLWGSGIAFALLFGSLFAKTYRVHRLFNNRKLKRLKLNSAYVLRIVAGIVVVEIVLLIAIHFLFPREAVTTVVLDPLAVRAAATAGGGSGAPSSSGGTIYVACMGAASSGNGAFSSGVRGTDGMNVLWALHLAFLFWGAYLAFRTRDVPFAGNEAAWMAMAIYNVVVCEILAVILTATSDASGGGLGVMQHAVSIIRFGVPPAATLLLLYVPKAHAVWRALAEEKQLARANGPRGGGGGGGGGGAGPVSDVEKGAGGLSPQHAVGGTYRGSPSAQAAVLAAAGGSSGSVGSGESSGFRIDERGNVHGFDLRAWLAQRSRRGFRFFRSGDTTTGGASGTVQSSEGGTRGSGSRSGKRDAKRAGGNRVAPSGGAPGGGGGGGGGEGAASGSSSVFPHASGAGGSGSGSAANSGSSGSVPPPSVSGSASASHVGPIVSPPIPRGVMGRGAGVGGHGSGSSRAGVLAVTFSSSPALPAVDEQPEEDGASGGQGGRQSKGRSPLSGTSNTASTAGGGIPVTDVLPQDELDGIADGSLPIGAGVQDDSNIGGGGGGFGSPDYPSRRGIERGTIGQGNRGMIVVTAFPTALDGGVAGGTGTGALTGGGGSPDAARNIPAHTPGDLQRHEYARGGGADAADADDEGEEEDEDDDDDEEEGEVENVGGNSAGGPSSPNRRATRKPPASSSADKSGGFVQRFVRSLSGAAAVFGGTKAAAPAPAATRGGPAGISSPSLSSSPSIPSSVQPAPAQAPAPVVPSAAAAGSAAAGPEPRALTGGALLPRTPIATIHEDGAETTTSSSSNPNSGSMIHAAAGSVSAPGSLVYGGPAAAGEDKGVPEGTTPAL